MNYFHLIGAVLVGLPFVSFFVWAWFINDGRGVDGPKFLSSLSLTTLSFILGAYLLSL